MYSMWYHINNECHPFLFWMGLLEVVFTILIYSELHHRLPCRYIFLLLKLWIAIALIKQPLGWPEQQHFYRL